MIRSFNVLSAAALAALVAGTGLGFAHGPAPGAHYDGHAAALGEPGDPKSVTRTMEYAHVVCW